jgi:toxin ParE1/3/4
MRGLYIEPEAEAELEAAALRYEAANGGLGAQFLGEMRLRVLDIQERPFSFPVFGGADDVRCAHAVGRFPHLVVFILAGESIHVLAFMHPRQRPGYWQHRVPGAI